MYEPGQNPQGSGVLDRAQQAQSGSERLTYGDQTISNLVALPFLEAFIDATGEPVTVIAACNWLGHSSAEIVVNRRGKLQLGAFEEITIVDARSVPNQQLSELRQRQVQIQQKLGLAPGGYQQTQLTR